MSQDIMRQRNHLIKANQSTVIGQNTFLLPAATPSDHMTPNWLDILRRGFRVITPSLVLISQGFAEIWPNFLFGVFAAEFDWLYRTNGFENEKPLDNFCEGWSDDDVSQIWGRLDRNWRRSSEKTCFSVIQNGGRINSAVIKNDHGSHMGCPKISWDKGIT